MSVTEIRASVSFLLSKEHVLETQFQADKTDVVISSCLAEYDMRCISIRDLKSQSLLHKLPQRN